MLVNDYYSYKEYSDPIDEIFLRIKNFISDNSYIMISSSMGALILYECCCRIKCKNMPLPERVFLISLTSPLYIEKIKQNEERCISSIYNNQNSRLLKVIKKLVLRDFSLVKNITFHSIKLETKAFVFYASEDIMTFDIKSWNKYFSEPIYQKMKGDHFIFITSASLIVEEIKKNISSDYIII